MLDGIYRLFVTLCSVQCICRISGCCEHQLSCTLWNTWGFAVSFSILMLSLTLPWFCTWPWQMALQAFNNKSLHWLCYYMILIPVPQCPCYTSLDRSTIWYANFMLHVTVHPSYSPVNCTIQNKYLLVCSRGKTYSCAISKATAMPWMVVFSCTCLIPYTVPYI